MYTVIFNELKKSWNWISDQNTVWLKTREIMQILPGFSPLPSGTRLAIP